MRAFSLISFQHQPLSRRNNFPIEKGSSLYSHAASAAQTIANPRLASANIQDNDAVDDEEQDGLQCMSDLGKRIPMHFNASQCISMHPNASRCIPTHLDASQRIPSKRIIHSQ